MNKTIVLGHAHPYHENSYSWVVDAFDDAETAQKLVHNLNSISTKWYPKWLEEPRAICLSICMVYTGSAR